MLKGVLTLVAAITAAEALRETSANQDPHVQLTRRWIVVVLVLFALILTVYVTEMRVQPQQQKLY